MSNLLIKGSIWQHKKAVGTEKGLCTVVGVSNKNQPESVLEKYPSCVVFESASGELCTINVEDFVKSRVFHAAARLEPVLQQSSTIREAETERSVPLQIVARHDLTTLCNTALRGYRQSPDLAQGVTLHTLAFDPQEVYAEDLMRVFHQDLDSSVTEMTVVSKGETVATLEELAYVGLFESCTAEGTRTLEVVLATPYAVNTAVADDLVAQQNAAHAQERRAAQAQVTTAASAPLGAPLDNAIIDNTQANSVLAPADLLAPHDAVQVVATTTPAFQIVEG